MNVKHFGALFRTGLPACLVGSSGSLLVIAVFPDPSSHVGSSS